MEHGLFQDPTFWFLVSFALFFVFFGRAIWEGIRDGLDGRSRGIESDIQDAINMKEEAQELLNQIRHKQQEAGRHAEAIIEHARLEAERLRSEAAQELDEYMRHREQLVEERINYAELEALKSIKETAATMALTASEKILRQVVDADTDAELADQAIKDLPKVVAG